MRFVSEMVSQALSRIFSGDADVLATSWRTLWLALMSTAIAALLGAPLGAALGAARPSRLRRAALTLANAGLGLPPVVLGVFLALLLLPGAPLGSLNWTDTIGGVLLAQTLLALPIVVALVAGAVAGLPGGLLSQAAAFGAGPVARGLLALREARIGVVAALIAALGSALAEVGAVVIVGGNIEGKTSTLASTVLLDRSGADPAQATAHVIVLLALVTALAGLLTVVQHRGRR